MAEKTGWRTAVAVAVIGAVGMIAAAAVPIVLANRASPDATTPDPTPPAAEPAAKPAGPTDLDRLQGTWEVESRTGDPQLTQDDGGHDRWTFHGTELTTQRVVDGKPREHGGTVTLRADADPKQFDFVGGGPRDGKPLRLRGVYKFDGDAFVVCFVLRPGNDTGTDRAHAFDPGPRGGRIQIRFRRFAG